MANDARGRARGGTHREANFRIATPRRGVGVQREAVAGETITFPLIVGLIHLAIVQAVATLVYTRGNLNPTLTTALRRAPADLVGIADPVVEPMRQWDGLWYRLIAIDGYDVNSATAAFWPLFPWLMNVGSTVSGIAPETIGYLIANVSFFGALILLYRLISLDFDREIARRTLVALAFFPTALFFSAVYTESLFLLLIVASLYAARQEQWFAAGLYGMLAALTRSQGVLLLLPFAVLFLQQHRFELRRWFPNAIFAALPALGPVIFGWQLKQARYGWLEFVDVQELWERHPAWPWRTVQDAWNAADWGWVSTFIDDPTWTTLTSSDFRNQFSNSDAVELVFTALFFLLALVGLRILPLYQNALVWPALLIPLFGPSDVHPLMSMPRFGIVLFPLYVVLAFLVRDRRIALPALAVSLLLLVIFTAQFAQGYWVS
jgi:hypothetical protein